MGGFEEKFTKKMQVPTPDIQLSFYVRFYVSRKKAKKNR